MKILQKEAFFQFLVNMMCLKEIKMLHIHILDIFYMERQHKDTMSGVILDQTRPLESSIFFHYEQWEAH